jgi:hypothetical protein
MWHSFANDGGDNIYSFCSATLHTILIFDLCWSTRLHSPKDLVAMTGCKKILQTLSEAYTMWVKAVLTGELRGNTTQHQGAQHRISA